MFARRSFDVLRPFFLQWQCTILQSYKAPFKKCAQWTHNVDNFFSNNTLKSVSLLWDLKIFFLHFYIFLTFSNQYGVFLTFLNSKMADSNGGHFRMWRILSVIDWRAIMTRSSGVIHTHIKARAVTDQKEIPLTPTMKQVLTQYKWYSIPSHP